MDMDRLDKINKRGAVLIYLHNQGQGGRGNNKDAAAFAKCSIPYAYEVMHALWKMKKPPIARHEVVRTYRGRESFVVFWEVTDIDRLSRIIMRNYGIEE